MSEELDDLLADVLADPARLLTADREALRDHLAAAANGAESVGREVFVQAEAIFGGAEVSAAEFGSWLHFAAKATGHEEYAERLAKAEPGMPWRTVWAWWRPANWFMAHPSLNGDYYQVHRRLYEGRELIEVVDHRGPLWLDAETGRRVRVVRDEGPLAEAPLPPGVWDAPELSDWDLTAPESWEGAVAFAAEGGRTRYLVQDTHGIAVLETDAEVLRDWPRGDGIDPTSSEDPPLDAEPAQRRPSGPLTAARVDDAFGERHVVRTAESALPAGLEHPGSRRHLRDIGLPKWWVCHGAEYEAHPADAMRPPADGDLAEDGLPGGMAAADLIAFGTCDYGELYLHRHDGSVHIWSRLDGPTDGTLVPLAPDLDVFTRILEAVYRYSNACWHPYPVEGDQEVVAQVFLDEVAELAPGLFDPETSSGVVWSWLYAGITELGVDGF
ncbi:MULTISPECIES: SUKH-4 family immunity protein [unclassified Streptomyces]|uniref:SUKH-4 family immunity protein n=1 Tax=unclassified Streptomyces TaxID=2593676 RepID=UPI002365013C|nr:MULTISPECIES: SUKH-4 family immunity protein [unclassified Streptomyces]MDF3140171.1 SUKH-4 family immunity protein [Streptomyces sp. T21Q-yed]WDF41719.1 SUKH-4 family immunity protein [Streptomyces sp. T12]